jgi:hypothetical protein
MDLVNTISKLHSTIDDLIAKHQPNDYVFGRLVNYIQNLLPGALDNATELNKQRETRRNILSANQDEFTARFLKRNNYFYSPPTELFLHYDGLHFVLRNEDDIYHQIQSTISSEKCLREWRHKVNKNIIKRIKERSPLTVIPESVTIQFVINTLCPAIFKTRHHVKYFLSIIGECLMKKKQITDITESNALLSGSSLTTTSNELIYIFPLALKELIREIGNQCYTIFGLPNIFTNIKFKYYDHNYNHCRLISINQKKIEIPPMLTKHMLDFLCVASHYHLRYGSADKFLQQCNDSRLVDNALFLSKNTPESIVNTFIEKSFTLSPTASIDTKNMIFVWKKFLDERNIPNIIFYETLKTILKKKLQYDEQRDCFIGITSIHLPVVALFRRFWEETMVTIDAPNESEEVHVDALEPDAPDAPDEPEEQDDCELEVDEICVLFKHWTNNTKTINEGLVIELIQHFYPEAVLENNKYILHTSCKLWDKYNEVANALVQFKLYLHNSTTQTNIASNIASNTDDPYVYYSLHCKISNKYNLLVSKRYFERIVSDIIVKELDLVFP